MNKMPPAAAARDQRRDEHIESLIPWYVNGTLDDADTRHVQQHLENCELCRASVQLERKVASLVFEHRDTLDCAPQSGWNRLAAQLDAPQPAHENNVSPRRRRRIRIKRLVPALLIVQAAAIAGLGISLVQLLDRRTEPAYHTLSDAPRIAAAAAPTLRVVFADATSNEKLRVLLEQIGGTIRSGPTANGVYTIELQKSDGAAALDWLRTQPEVLFAEPVGALQAD